MSYEDLKARLTELGGLLGRKVPLTGSSRDLEARVEELEAELAALDEETADNEAGEGAEGEGESTDNHADGGAGEERGGQDAAERVCVTMRVTVDIPCLDVNGGTPAYALAGQRVSVPSDVAEALKCAGLAR